jgi:hypothetical protein
MRKPAGRASDAERMKARSDEHTPDTAGKSMHGAWSTPHNWCDRRCERCPVALDCAVHVACRRRCAERVARGEDPDSYEAKAEDVLENLESAVCMLEQMAGEAGIDIHQRLPQPPIALDAVRVQRAGEQVVRALAQVRVPVDLASEALADAADETIALWSLLVVKAVRVFSYTVAFDPDVWAQRGRHCRPLQGALGDRERQQARQVLLSPGSGCRSHGPIGAAMVHASLGSSIIACPLAHHVRLNEAPPPRQGTERLAPPRQGIGPSSGARTRHFGRADAASGRRDAGLKQGPPSAA